MEKEVNDLISDIMALAKVAINQVRETSLNFEIVMGDMRETMKLMKEVLDSDELKSLLERKKKGV